MTLHSAAWLSAGAETLVRELDMARHAPFDCDLLIVGSGYGGAVAAARLAGTTVDDGGHGRRPAVIWVVERGREYLRGMFPSRFSEVPGHVRFSAQDGKPPRGYAEALFDLRLGTDVHVLLGSGLGGGSLINAGVMERPDPSVWANGWPDALDRDRMDAACDEVLTMLQAGPAPMNADAATRLAKFGVLDDMARFTGAAAQPCRVAVNFGPARQNAAGVEMNLCTLCGDCMTGCNQGAKATLDTNYLAQAVRRGVRIFCGATVERLQAAPDPGEPWRVAWHHTEPSIRPASGLPHVIRARQVILAAGALGSTEILLRSRSPALALSPMLGRRFSTNGDQVAAVYRHTRPVNAAAAEHSDPADPQARQVGPTITGLVRTQAGGAVPIVVEEFAVPAALSRVFGEIVSTFGVFGLKSRIGDPAGIAGEDPYAATGQAISHSGLYGFMGDDGAGGRIERAQPGAGDAAGIDTAARIVWPALRHHPLFEAQMDWLDKACSPADSPVGGKPVFNPLWKPFGNDLPRPERHGSRPEPPLVPPGPAVTVHPLGGCAMADNAREGVVDHAGRVFREGKAVHPGLAVLDGSIVPKSLGINPALTIAALAEQAVVVLRKDWGFEAPAADAATLPGTLTARPVWAGRRPAPPPVAAARIRESLQGRLTIGQGLYWARLEVSFGEIPNLDAMLLQVHKEVPIDQAELTLYPTRATDDEFSWPTPSQPVVRARLAGRVLLFVPQRRQAKRQLVYEFTVRGLEHGSEGPLRTGQSVRGTKWVASGGSRNPWHQLMNMDLSVDGVTSAGILRLDLDDLARRRDPLLTLVRQSSAPDGLAALAGLGLYILRIFLLGQANILLPPQDYRPERIARNLAQRLPGKVGHGMRPTVHAFGPHGARLSRYRPAGKASGRPVMLIHGFGASGSTFAHPSIPTSMVAFLVDKGRDTWVLDLRTSIGNEPPQPGDARGGPWTFDEVAHGDIPAALALVNGTTGQQVDVVAHCIGAAMFCVATLDRPEVHERIGAVVLSQVGPLLRMSPANRLRGYLASYLEQFIGATEFDTRPDYHRVRKSGGRTAWAKDASGSLMLKAIDMVLATLPYPEDDHEAAIAERLGVDFRTVRHRSDAIWGHLMEAANVADETWKHLDAINGWVKVRSLAQTIHYARHRLLTDAQGRNRALRQERLVARFGFPVLLLHGQRNRVFDWRGSLDSFQLLHRVRGGGAVVPEPAIDGDSLHWGGHSDLQLRVFRRYGHQDCMVGKAVAQDIFEPMLDFLQTRGERPAQRSAVAPELPISFEPPWVGPMIGRPHTHDRAGRFGLRLLVHPHPRHARTLGTVLVPINRETGRPDTDYARGVVPARRTDAVVAPRKFAAPDHDLHDHTEALLSGAMALSVDASFVPSRFEDFLVLTVHSDLDLAPEDIFERVTAPLEAMVVTTPDVLFGTALAATWRARLVLESDWLPAGWPLHPRTMRRLCQALGAPLAEQRFAQARLRLSDAAWRAADAPQGRPQPLCFAVASCQYPPGLMDEACAGASYRRLARACRGADGPVPQFLLALGDQVYVDATAGLFDPGSGGRPGDELRKAYELNWRLAPFREVASQLPIYTMLDDHEIRDNWQPRPGGSDDLAARLALRAFQRHQGTLNPPPLREGGRHYSFTPAGALVVVLDSRTQRDLRRVGPFGEGHDLWAANIVPDALLDDICARLKDAGDAVKFIVTPSPVLPLERMPEDRPEARLRSDSWSGYPRSLLKLLAFIRNTGLQRVVFLSGDAHGSAVSKLVFDNGVAVYAVMSSGLHAPWPFANARAEEFVLDGPVSIVAPGGERLSGTMHTAAWSSRAGYARVSLEADGDEPQALLTVSLCSADGTTIDCRHDLRAPGGDWSVNPSAPGTD